MGRINHTIENIIFVITGGTLLNSNQTNTIIYSIAIVILLIAILVIVIKAIVDYKKDINTYKQTNYEHPNKVTSIIRETNNNYRKEFDKKEENNKPVKIEENQKTNYSVKKSLMTPIEKKYYKVFKQIINDKYILQPQVNLATIIEKTSDEWTTHNDLYRNIDFCVFNKDNFEPLLLIEINDKTHTQSSRIKRDEKVKAICAKADITLIAFWTEYGINEYYINQRLSKYLPLLQA